MRDPRVDRAIGVCKKVVGALSDAQDQLKLPDYEFITESPTRWGSRQHMIQRFIEQEKAFRHVLGAEKRRHLIPTWQDVDVLESETQGA